MGFEVTEAQGFVGNFTTTISTQDGSDQDHRAWCRYCRNRWPGTAARRNMVMVLFPMSSPRLNLTVCIKLKEQHVAKAKSFVFIQCVGSREGDRMYCSKVCCTHSVQSAIELKQEDPSRMVYILYRDMRTYGQREALYKKARELGVIFINYELHGKPKVSVEHKQVNVEVWDHVLHRPLQDQGGHGRSGHGHCCQS